MHSANTWFEIPVTDLATSQRFYEALLDRPMRGTEDVGGDTMAVFAHEKPGAGGCIVHRPADAGGSGGTVVYLDCAPSVEAALARARQGRRGQDPDRTRHRLFRPGAGPGRQPGRPARGGLTMPMRLPLRLYLQAHDGAAAGPRAVPSDRAPRNWIAVASAEHARRGRDHAPTGFMQVGHGKEVPLRRIAPGHRIAYYAPSSVPGGKDRLQSFVSLGTVLPGEPYMADMGGGFVPWRRDVRYVSAHDAPIGPLISRLDCIDDPSHWGSKFRFGLVSIGDGDMRCIARAMGADLGALGL